MFIRKYVIPLIAVAGAGLAVHTVRSQSQDHPAARPVSPPPRSPYGASVAGSGIIEASTENIAIGSNLSGIVVEVFVKPGDRVKEGDPLFRLDDRALRAELRVKQTNLAVLQQTLTKWEKSPRPEDIPPAEARVEAAAAQLDDAETLWKLISAVSDKRAVSEEDLGKRRFAYLAAKARLAEAKAELEKLKAGTWSLDLDVQRAQVDAARAEVEGTQTEIDRLTVRAPVAGEILQRNVRPGEFAMAGPVTDRPLIMLGNTDVLHVRVDVDENDAWRVTPGARARATLRGNSALGADLRFVRVEPYVIPKRSLTGESTERVDTRVLQVLYSFPKGALSAYVGQLVDVNIEAEPNGG
jgi:multidrug efflux pump subunit AcrA (membrane-fusion protein)